MSASDAPLAASDHRHVDDDTGFGVILNNLRDIHSGINGASIRLRRYAIDGSVMIVAESYDDGVTAIALTKQQAHVLGLWLAED